ncbi:uncharacterized protein LOC131687437 [Topomyia yanbarensis]|uniref:uncharacterized protein LOC131687437 n=1 Tax=Topomyia yanbarensis TaxID=2498891 RepID=UPI00273C5557|nr:uncharacterized protein LOC131687437 [Topomyia yanbarensis]
MAASGYHNTHKTIIFKQRHQASTTQALNINTSRQDQQHHRQQQQQQTRPPSSIHSNTFTNSSNSTRYSSRQRDQRKQEEPLLGRCSSRSTIARTSRHGSSQRTQIASQQQQSTTVTTQRQSATAMDTQKNNNKALGRDSVFQQPLITNIRHQSLPSTRTYPQNNLHVDTQNKHAHAKRSNDYAELAPGIDANLRSTSNPPPLHRKRSSRQTTCRCRCRHGPETAESPIQCYQQHETIPGKIDEDKYPANQQQS